MFNCHRKKILVTGTLVLMVCWSCRFYFDTTKDVLTTQKTPSSFERGRNLVYTVCGGCHLNHTTGKFTGNSLNDLPTIAGHLYSANLTHAALYGMPDKYSDAELFYLLKRGIAKNGKFMPYMMRPMMADDDINDVIVYLRSDDSALAADDISAGQTKINFIGRTGMWLLTRPQPYNKGVTRPNEDAPVAYGRYLVGIIGCYHCHSSKASGLDYLNPEHSIGYLQGGMKLKDPDGKRIYSANLTPCKETGIGNFTKEEFRDAVRKGISPAGRVLRPPMGKFDKLSDKQVDAIYTYLQSLPPVRNYVSRNR